MSERVAFSNTFNLWEDLRVFVTESFGVFPEPKSGKAANGTYSAAGLSV